MGDSASAAGDAKEGATQQKVKRLNSLLFGVDLAFSKGDTDTALGLGLRLLGFLESQCQTAEDVVYVEPIQRKVLQKLNLATLVDRRQALEQAKTPADFKFKQHRPIDIEKIKASKYYMGPIQRAQSASLAALRITKNTSISSVPAASLRTADDANYHGVCESGRVATKPGQSLTQSKIMSLYSNGSHKAVEPAQGQTEHMLDSNNPDPDKRGKNSLASKYFSGLYHSTQTGNKEPISISSPEAEEKHNLYAYT